VADAVGRVAGKHIGQHLFLGAYVIIGQSQLGLLQSLPCRPSIDRPNVGRSVRNGVTTLVGRV
jgi:hypothetical protein